jgi:signal transduction histidine kinase
MSRRAIRRVVRTLALAAFAVCTPAWAQPPEARTVLAIFFSTENYPTNPLQDTGIREGLLSGSAPISLFTEYLESDQLPPEQATLALRDYLREKYRNRRIDLVMPMTETSVRFALRFRQELFPDAPIVYSADIEIDDATRREGAGVTGVVVGNVFDETLVLARKLHPSTERIFIVARTPNISFGESFRLSMAEKARPAALASIDEGSIAGLIDAVKAVPPRSVILFIRQSREDPGRILFPSDVARIVAGASHVPVYGVSDTYIGSGVVGGVMFRSRLVGRRMGEMARQVLEGTRAQDMPVEHAPIVPTFDWRQLQRWGISESQLPAGSDILFRQPSVWELYRGYILGGALIMIVQSALIAGLTVQRVRRRRVETALRESEQRSRETAEQNQDLAGRLIHAQEEERTRIARDLHDDLSQQLAGLSIMLSGLKRKIGKPDSQADVDRTVSTLQDRASGLAESIRNLSHELHPSMLQHAGLVTALRTHCAEVEQHHHVNVRCHADESLDAVGPDIALCLFRIAQEALSNAVRHARATTITVELKAELDGVELLVVDDGVGFVASGRTGSGLGLRSIDERVRLARGQVTVESQPGEGTRVFVRIPLAIERPQLA